MWIGGGHLVMAGNFHLVTAAGTSIPGPSTDTLAPTLQVGSATTASFFFIKKRLLLVNFTVRFQPMCGQSILLSEDATCGHGRVIHQTEVYRESIRHFSKHVEDRQWVHEFFVWAEGCPSRCGTSSHQAGEGGTVWNVWQASPLRRVQVRRVKVFVR